MNAYLNINSNDPDICGDWHASDVEAEMIDLEIPLENNRSWLEYVLDHNFEDYDLDTCALAKILNSSDNMTIDMMIKDVNIHIEFECSYRTF